jgi:hypothetical protein
MPVSLSTWFDFIRFSLCITIDFWLPAGLCVQSPEKREALIHLLRRALEVSVFPTKDLIDNLRSHWAEND